MRRPPSRPSRPSLARISRPLPSLAARAAAAMLLLCLAAPPAAGAAEPLIIGEHLKDTVLESPHPYPGAAGGEPQLVWSDHYLYPGAAHLVFEFARFDLAPGDWVEVRDPKREQVHVYRGRGFQGKGGDFITKMILGPEAYIDLYSRRPASQHYGYRIERITRGFDEAEMAARYGPAGAEAICGTDDKEDAICYESSFPEVYDRSRAVARILMDGAALCTAWLVSCENHVITNNHCTWDADDAFDTQGELDRMEFQFLYQDATCGGGGAGVEYSFMGGTWLENDQDLDYTLIRAPAGEDPASTYGWLRIDYRLPAIDELMYVVGHPSGRPKEISLYSTHPSDQDNPDGFCEVYSTDEPVCVGGTVPEVGYMCDTEGGSSGSPVLSRGTNKVIALHHCANCPNRGVRIQNIWDANQAGANPLPACSLLEDLGTVELDRGSYGCSDTISIEVIDGSLQGAGTQDVIAWSDTEPAAETVTLTESPAGSGGFVGTLATSTAAPSTGDGSLSVTHGDAITVRYIDADDGQGGTNLPRDAFAAADCQGPAISGVQVVNLAGTAATVAWTTDEPADSEVFFGTAPPAWTAASQPDLVSAHAVDLAGLAECSTYYLWVRSTDEAGNTAADDNGGSYYTFETGVSVQPTYAASGLPAPILDGQNTVSVITVPDDRVVLDVDVGVDISHTYDGDVDLYLSGPGGAEIALSLDNGGTGDDYTGTTFDDEAPTPIGDGTPPFTGAFRPEEPLSTFDGSSALGGWQLRVFDDATGDTGTLQAWSLTLTFPAQACGPQASYESHGLDADLCSGGGAGDGDGVWDAGEQVTFQVTLRNSGMDPLTGVQATVTPLTPGAAMLQDTASFGDLAVGATGASQAPPYAVLLPAGLSCGATVDFQIDVAANQGAWTDTFPQTVGTVIPGEGTALQEDFDAAGIPLDWTIVDGGGSTDTWFADDATDPAGCGNFDPNLPIGGRWAAVDSDCALNAAMDEELITPLIDLSGALSATLEFDHYFNQYGAEIADVDVRSSSTGGLWVNVGRWTADTANPQHETIDVTAQGAGAADFQVRWHYYDASFEWYWYVDNVQVTFTGPGGCTMTPCAPEGTPGEQAGAYWMDRDRYSWDVDPEATDGYTLYRGAGPDLTGLLDAGIDSCVRFSGVDALNNVADLAADDPAGAPGGFYWYLVTGWNGNGEGPAGDGAAGPRVVNPAGACP